MNNKSHSKFALLKKTDIDAALEAGKIDEHDILITKDTGELILVTENHELKAVNSRTYRYESVDEAVAALNTAEDTYIGQIVTIWDGNQYAGYVVNQRNGKYQIDPLAAPDIHLDYYDVKELTKAEYDALTDEEKHNGNIYLVTDESDYPCEMMEIATEITYGTLYVNAFTHVASLTVDTEIKRTVSGTEWLELGLLPKAYRPANDIYFTCMCGDNLTIPLCGVADKYGLVKLCVKGRTSITGIHGSCMYLYK